jgi:hypothetical protein
MVVILSRIALINRFQQVVRGVVVDGIEASIDQLLHTGQRVAVSTKRVRVRLRKEECICMALPRLADQESPGLGISIVGLSRLCSQFVNT